MITPLFKLANPASTILEPGEVHLWRYRFGQDDPVPDDAAHVLSKAEHKRAASVPDPDRRARIIESRVILRHLLAGYVSLQPSEVRIRKGKLGRPKLDARHLKTDLDFNLSHSGDLMVLAVAIDNRLGVDVELLRTRPGLDKLVRRVFSADEQTALSAVGEVGYLAAFFQGWTRKEALLKGAGAGVFRQASETEVSLADTYRPQIYKYQGSREQAKERCLLSFQPLGDAVGALAVSAGAWRIRYFAFESGVFQQ
jgi:4'-phosphopantetheinyl transferase